jgi:hypothetical protein
MFSLASIFNQDLSSWDFCGFVPSSIQDFFSETTQMLDNYYPECALCGGDLDVSSSSGPYVTFSNQAELMAAVNKYMGDKDAWAESDCDGTPCGQYYGYAKLLT